MIVNQDKVANLVMDLWMIFLSKHIVVAGFNARSCDGVYVPKLHVSVLYERFLGGRLSCVDW